MKAKNFDQLFKCFCNFQTTHTVFQKFYRERYQNEINAQPEIAFIYRGAGTISRILKF